MTKFLLRDCLICLSASFLFIGCSTQQEERADDAKVEWNELFNGKDLDDWVVKICKHELGDNYGRTFRVEEGVLRVSYDKYDNFEDRFGHIYYKQAFSSYHLVVEYRFPEKPAPGTPEWAFYNSGIMLHCQDPKSILRNQNFPMSIEMQLLAGLGDGRERPTGNMCSPGTEVYYRGEIYPEHCLSSSSPTFQPDEWVRAEAIVYSDSLITHVINGDTVLQYEKPHIGGGVIDGYDPAIKRDGMPVVSGWISLQSEGSPIDFRKVEIRELKN